jgi:hypothetical protein
MKKTFVAVMTVPVLELIVSSVVGGVGPASAAPCTSWVLIGPATIVHNDGFTIKGIPGLPPSDPDNGSAQLFMPDGTQAWIDGRGYPSKNPQADVAADEPQSFPKGEFGRVSGGPQGNNLNFTIVWLGLNPKVATTSTYTGTIDANGHASGSDTNNQNHVKGETWQINEPFTCS